MKKVFNSLFVIIAAMVAFAGCAKQEIATPEAKTVQFFANSIETKTVFGDPDGTTYPTLWTDGGKVKVLLNIDQVGGAESTSEIECSDDFRSATFKAEFTATPETYVYYAISPSTAYNGKSSNDGRITVVVPTDQDPLEASVDESAQILYARADASADQSVVDLDFHHLTAYGKLSLINLTDNVSSISKVQIVAPEDVYISGKWNYLVEDETISAHNKDLSNTITLNTTRTTDIWFACAPVDVSDKTLTITVTTDKGDLVKEITFPADRKFESGRIAKFAVDMAGIEVGGTDEPEQPSETEWVATQFADLKAGDQVVIVSTKGSDAYAMTNDKGTGDAPATLDVAYANDKLSTTPGDNIIWTVSVDGDNRIFHPNGDTSKWLYCTSSNNGVRVGTNANKTFKLDSESGYMVHVGTSRYIGVYNAQDWRCYTSINDNIKNQTFQFFVNAGSGSDEPEQPKTLVSIAVTGQTTSYLVDEIFEFDGTVTATYSDGTTSEVEPTDYTEPDLTTAGTQEVVVSYTEAGETVETRYSVTVTEPVVATIEEFLAAPVDKTVWYQLTGKIKEIENDTYGNFYLEDATGYVYVYGLTEFRVAENDKSFSKLELEEGDLVTLNGTRDQFVQDQKEQVGGPAYYVDHLNFVVKEKVINVDADVTEAEFKVMCDRGFLPKYPDGVEEVSIESPSNEPWAICKVKFPVNETAEPKTYVISIEADVEGFEIVKTVTINQAAAEQGGGEAKVEVWSWAGGGKANFTGGNIEKTYGLGSDYAATHAPYQIKMDDTGDYFIIKVDGAIKSVSVGVKMIGGGTNSTLDVQGSSDGESYSSVEKLTISGSQNAILELQTTKQFDPSYRYLKFYFTKGSNIGVGPISITYTVGSESGGETPETPVEPTLTPRNLTFSAATATATVGQAFDAPTLSGVTTGVTYSSSNTAVATVNASTGAVTLVGAGTTTITASATATNVYEAGTASYTLTVTAAQGGGQQTTTTYTFNSKSWGDSTNSWTSGKAGNQLTSGQGVQVTTGVSGANATCKNSFSNVSTVVVRYCTNASKGAGTIKVTIGSVTKTFTVSTSGGTSLRNATFDFNGATGTPKIEVTCTTNSIYVNAISITHTN